MSGLTWTMTGSPCGRPSAIDVFQESDGHTCHPRALLQRFCVRKLTFPLNGIGRASFGPSKCIGLKADIGPRVFPVHRPKVFNLCPTSECLLPSQSTVVLGGPQTGLPLRLSLRHSLRLSLCLPFFCLHLYRKKEMRRRMLSKKYLIPTPTRRMGGSQKAGYRPTCKNKNALRRWRQGKSVGFTWISSLKAKGLIPRSNGTKRVSPKYR
jgi:hypothetical protein